MISSHIYPCHTVWEPSRGGLEDAALRGVVHCRDAPEEAAMRVPDSRHLVIDGCALLTNAFPYRSRDARKVCGH